MGNQTWTTKEEKTLIGIFADPLNKASIQQIADFFNRSKKAVERKKEKMKLGSSRRNIRHPKPHLHYPVPQPGKSLNPNQTQKVKDQKQNPVLEYSKRKSTRNWTPREDQFLIQNYDKRSIKEIAEAIGKTKESVHNRKNILRRKGIPEVQGPPIKDKNAYQRNNGIIQNNQFIIQNYDKLSIKEIAEALGKSKATIFNRIQSLRKKNVKEVLGSPKRDQNAYQRKHNWTPEEDQFIIQNYYKLPIIKIGEALGKTRMATYGRVRTLREKGAKELQNPKRHCHTQSLTTENEEFLLQNYGKIPTTELAKKLGKTVSYIYNRIQTIRKKGTTTTSSENTTNIPKCKSFYMDEEKFELLHNYMLECETLEEVAQKLECRVFPLQTWLYKNKYTASPDLWRKRFPQSQADKPSRGLLNAVITSAKMLCLLKDPRSIKELKTLKKQTIRLQAHFPQEISKTIALLEKTIKHLHQPKAEMETEHIILHAERTKHQH